MAGLYLAKLKPYIGHGTVKGKDTVLTHYVLIMYTKSMPGNLNV
jgi:hypothetical protein